jgi:hypothetical protein
VFSLSLDLFSFLFGEVAEMLIGVRGCCDGGCFW